MEQGRRNLLSGVLSGAVAACCPIYARGQDIFPQSVSPPARRGRGSSLVAQQVESNVACANFAAFGFGEGGPTGLSQRSGIDWLDHLLSQELGIMHRVFQLLPGVLFFDDGESSNALATTQNFAGPQFRHGTVLIGKTLTAELLDKYSGRSPLSTGDHALGAVVAHEWAHIAQFSSGINFGSGMVPELHADFMSGWYQAGRVLSGGGAIRINFEEAAEELFGRGDFAFNSPSHHGMPHQRLAAYVSGAQTASRGVLRTADAFRIGLQAVSQ